MESKAGCNNRRIIQREMTPFQVCVSVARSTDGCRNLHQIRWSDCGSDERIVREGLTNRDVQDEGLTTREI